MHKQLHGCCSIKGLYILTYFPACDAQNKLIGNSASLELSLLKHWNLKHKQKRKIPLTLKCIKAFSVYDKIKKGIIQMVLCISGQTVSEVYFQVTILNFQLH